MQWCRLQSLAAVSSDDGAAGHISTIDVGFGGGGAFRLRDVGRIGGRALGGARLSDARTE
jgi:hypothetical protein